MQLSINSSLHYQIFGPSTFLFCLSCLKTEGQRIISESLTTCPETDRTDLSVGTAHNRFTKLNVPEPGDLKVNYQAVVEASANLIDIDQIPQGGVESLGETELPYLFPSRYAPSDLMRGAASALFGGKGGIYETALAIEDWLYRSVAYQIGSSIEQSSATDTFLSRIGVCRDFAHLGIAFCRALNIPARYVTVYAHQLEPQDFHAVFEVYIGGRWYLMDGTRKAPLNGMVRIATGRDASDVAMAMLFGNIAGTHVEVQTSAVEESSETFSPITRRSLLDKGKALYIG